MRALDADVLACALNRWAPEHPRASRVLDVLANGDAPWALPWPALHEFLGLVSRPHAVVRPLRASDASAFVEQLLTSPSVRTIGPTPRHAAALAEVLALLPPDAPLPRGLELAVVLREHGVREILSGDRGLRRFPFLAVRDPFHGAEWSPHEIPTRRYRRLVRG